MNDHEAIGKALCWLAAWAQGQHSGEVFVRRDEVCDGRMFVEVWRYNDTDEGLGYEQRAGAQIETVDAPGIRAALEEAVAELKKLEVSK